VSRQCLLASGPTARQRSRLKLPSIAKLLLAFPKEVRHFREMTVVCTSFLGRSWVMCCVIALEGGCGTLFPPTNHNPASFIINFRFCHFLPEGHVGNIRMGPFISQELGSLYIVFIANATEDNSMCGCMRGISTTCVQRYVHDGSEMRRATQTPLRRPAGRNRNSTF
jgi:hypothetical protein